MTRCIVSVKKIVDQIYGFSFIEFFPKKPMGYQKQNVSEI